jgi:hypothetical protein
MIEVLRPQMRNQKPPQGGSDDTFEGEPQRMTVDHLREPPIAGRT